METPRCLTRNSCPACWGRYYERRPWVMAGDLRRAHRELAERGLLPSTLPRPHAHLA